MHGCNFQTKPLVDQESFGYSLLCGAARFLCVPVVAFALAPTLADCRRRRTAQEPQLLLAACV
jgi:hypothetical protein